MADLIASSVPFSVGGWLGGDADATMQAIFEGASAALSDFYRERGKLIGDAKLMYLPERVGSVVEEGLRNGVEPFYKAVVKWRALIKAAKASVNTDALALSKAAAKLPSDPVSMDNIVRVRNHYEKLAKDVKSPWLRGRVDCLNGRDSLPAEKAEAKMALIAVLTVPASLDWLTLALRQTLENAVMGDANVSHALQQTLTPH